MSRVRRAAVEAHHTVEEVQVRARTRARWASVALAASAEELREENPDAAADFDQQAAACAKLVQRERRLTRQGAWST